MKTNFKKNWDRISERGILPKDAEARMWKNIHKETQKDTRFYVRKLIAACLILFAGLATYYATIETNFPIENELVYRQTYEGSVQFVRLPDGSKVWINENTILKFPKTFDAAHRTITLEGEAYFDVKKDTKKPFIIKSKKITTSTNGASFHLNTSPEEKQKVWVSKGSIKVGDVNVSSGFKGVYLNAKGFVKEKITYREPLWKQQIIDVDGRALVEILQQLKNDYQFNVLYQQDSIKQLKLKGILVKQPLDSMLTTLSYALNLKITPTGVNNTYTITSGNSKK